MHTTNDGWIGTNSGTAALTFDQDAVQFAVGSDGNSAAQARSTQFNGVRLADLTSLSYDAFVSADGSGGQAVYIILNVDYDGNGSTDDFLFFEPVYQTADFFPSNPQPSLQLNQWQTWDALNGGWWSVMGTAGANPGVGVKSLADILAVYPDARISTATAGAVRFVGGFGAGAWDNFVGSLDNVTVGVSSVDYTFDFDENLAPTPLPDSYSVGENESAALAVLVNDSDPDGDAVTLSGIASVSVDSANVAVDGVDASSAFQIDGDEIAFDPGALFDALGAGESATVTVTYSVSDESGHVSTTTATITVNGASDATIAGTNKGDIIHGDQGAGGYGREDIIFGGNGNDSLFGGAGADRLHGENGNDVLDGGAGNDWLSGGNGTDRLTGGAGADIFVFGRGGGNDVVTDFDADQGDRIQLEDGVTIKGVKLVDVDGVGELDTVLTLSNGSVTLLGTGGNPATLIAWEALVV